jgi:hypothetical protein
MLPVHAHSCPREAAAAQAIFEWVSCAVTKTAKEAVEAAGFGAGGALAAVPVFDVLDDMPQQKGRRRVVTQILSQTDREAGILPVPSGHTCGRVLPNFRVRPLDVVGSMVTADGDLNIQLGKSVEVKDEAKDEASRESGDGSEDGDSAATARMDYGADADGIATARMDQLSSDDLFPEHQESEDVKAWGEEMETPEQKLAKLALKRIEAEEESERVHREAAELAAREQVRVLCSGSSVWGLSLDGGCVHCALIACHSGTGLVREVRLPFVGL